MYIVIFGASGDLAKRKLFPELATLNNRQIRIIAYARSDIGKEFKNLIGAFCDYDEEFLSRITYLSGEYSDLTPLKEYISDPNAQMVYYLSLPPQVYPVILRSLEEFPSSTIAIEKPFGTDLQSFETLLTFTKHNLLSIDHYLVKPAMVAWPSLIPEFLKTRKYPDCFTFKKIEAVFAESIKVENAQHFDKAGVIMDVVQNHLVEVFATVMALLSQKSGTMALEEARADVIGRLKIKEGGCQCGQYERYAKEGTHPSKTETGTRLLFEYDRNGETIPVTFIAGKAFQKKETSIRVFIKEEDYKAFADITGGAISSEAVESMYMIFYVEPNLGIQLVAVTKGKEEKYTFISTEEITDCAISRFGQVSGHGIVFDNLALRQSVPSAGHEEVRNAWKLFQGIISNKSTEPKIYQEGISLKEFESLFDD